MAGRIPDSFIDGLLARVDIVELIGSRVPLKRKGKEYTACCPFHDERTPSFYVSPTKQFYHCFGCGAHGTPIKFLMEYDRLEFVDAVEELAKRLGLEVPRESGSGREAPREGQDLYAALDAAQKYFQRELANSEVAKRYLEKRGLDAATIEKFGIGWAPDGWNGLIDALGKGDARRIELLDKAGLLSKNDSGRTYDKFRARVMFPIHDRRGRVIAFGGRVIEKEDGPKYLNSPETALFHKGRELYGLWHARQAHSKVPRLIVVEGYMDVVSLWQFGITTAVATLGTATTPDHAELLFRNAADVYFCFDGDAAGRRAAWKALESVLPRMTDGRQAFFLFLPEGEDPDTVVRSQGAAALDAALAAAQPLSEFFFAQLSSDVDLSSADGKSRLAERAKAFIARIPDGEFRDRMQALLVQRTEVGFHSSAKLADFTRELVELGSQIQRDAFDMSQGRMPEGYLVSVPQWPNTGGSARGAGGERGGRFERGGPGGRRPRTAADRILAELPTLSAPRPAGVDHRRSLVRTAISLLLTRPSLAIEVEHLDWIETLDQPGIPLFVELVHLALQRPGLSTGALLEAVGEHQQIDALQKLAAQPLAGDDAGLLEDFRGCVRKLRQQAIEQRVECLKAQPSLDDESKSELRALLSYRI
ncbi:DNA primase [Silanimonas sp.]|jgi:DNA primase|uniref:DNA primase n=1 Tax=Silanimonas sp. TaxID=1929290 RepID=UPI0037C7CD4F